MDTVLAAVPVMPGINVEPIGVTAIPGWRGMKLPSPPKFTGGKRESVDNYADRVELYIAFYSSTSSDAESRNLFYLSYLGGVAQAALKPQLREYIEMKGPTRMNNNVAPITNDPEYIKTILLALFKDQTEIDRLEGEIRQIRQRGSASKYTAKYPRN